MTTVYFIRHCEAQGNVQRIFQGSTDLDITEMGAVQLQFLAARFLEVPLDAVYASPLRRAYKTGLAVAQAKGLSVQAEDGLREFDGGVFEGKLFAQTFQQHPDLAEIWENHPQDFVPENGEPMRDAYDRICTCVKKIVAQNPGKTLAVATHGGVIRCLMAYLQYGDITHLAEIPWSENTAIAKVEFAADGTHRVCSFNDRRHLPDEFCPKRSRIPLKIERDLA